MADLQIQTFVFGDAASRGALKVPGKVERCAVILPPSPTDGRPLCGRLGQLADLFGVAIRRSKVNRTVLLGQFNVGEVAPTEMSAYEPFKNRVLYDRFPP